MHACIPIGNRRCRRESVFFCSSFFISLSFSLSARASSFLHFYLLGRSGRRERRQKYFFLLATFIVSFLQAAGFFQKKREASRALFCWLACLVGLDGWIYI